MLNIIHLAMDSLGFIIVPGALWAIYKRSPSPKTGTLAKYYAAEPLLAFVGNLMMLGLGVHSLQKFALHGGWIDRAAEQTFDGWLTVGFLIPTVIYFALWYKARRKIKRGAAV